MWFSAFSSAHASAIVTYAVSPTLATNDFRTCTPSFSTQVKPAGAGSSTPGFLVIVAVLPSTAKVPEPETVRPFTLTVPSFA